MEKKRLILVDGYSFFFRAFFALKNIKNRSDGLPVNGVYGFTKMLINLIVDLKSTHIAVVFDTGGKTFRHDIFEGYKANRPPVPEEMIPQFPIIREVVDVLNIKSIEKSGYEADDIIATLSKQAKKNGYEVWIVSGDKDLMQLVDDNVFMYETKDNKIIGIKEVEEKWGVKPDKLLDVLSLMGDKADNVSGVPSIGEKTAIELINEFGSVENIIENVDNIKQEKRKKAIKENIDKLKLSKQLITLCDSVDLDGLNIDDLSFNMLNPARFRDFLNKMEFFSLARDVEKVFNVSNNNEENKKYKKITTIEDLKRNCDNIKDFYFEILTSNITGNVDFISFCNNDLYFAIHIKESSDLLSNNLSIEDVLGVLKNIFEDKNIKKISYDIKQSINILKQYNINIINYEDIKIIAYLLDNGKYNIVLSNIIEHYLYNNIEIKINNIDRYNSIIKKYELENKIVNIFDVVCFRIDMINTLYNILYSRIIDNKELYEIYENIEKPITDILANMEFLGVKIDINLLKQLSNDFSNDILRLEKEIHDISGSNFNINSPAQLSDILFNKLCLPKITKPTKSGIYSTDIETMETLYQNGFEIAGKIIEYRHFTKLKNTYTDALQKLVDNDGRVHTTFSNTNVITGRLSSNNPNLQNIPIRTEDGEKIRKTFISKNGYSFIGVDYSQIELRILAEYADVKRLKENFKNGLDIHTETAKKVFNINDITPDMRRIAKAINFSIVYGTTSFGLAKRLDKTNNEAKQYMDNYFELYPEIKEYMNNIKDFVKKNGYIKTMFNRICYINLNGPQKSFLERLAINAPIQGTGADIIKMAMIKVNEAIENYDANILLQIHDELLIEVKDEELEEVKNIVKNTMENIVDFGVDFPVEIKTGKNWGDVH